MDGPLNGLRVLDLGRVVAAPFAAQILGDLGAEVIKVERPEVGDDSRRYGPSFLERADGGRTAGFYLAFNRNKRSITVDLARPEGQAIVRDLASRSDVLIENFKAGDLARRGLGYADLAAVSPGLVYCSITGFGHTGPYAALPGLDMVFQAMSGLMSVTGEAEGAPQKVGIVACDFICGLYAANAIQAALRAREQNGGGGQHIDMALMDCAVSAMSHRAMDYFITGQAPMRSGNVAPGTAPAQLFRCSDGWLNVQAGSDSQFAKLCRALDVTHLLDDPHLKVGTDRVTYGARLVPELERLFEGRTVSHWHGVLQAGGVICSPVNDIRDAFDDPQVRARRMQVQMRSDAGETVSGVRSPMRFSDAAMDRYDFPPHIGEHTDAILEAVLGMTPDRIAALRSAKVI